MEYFLETSLTFFKKKPILFKLMMKKIMATVAQFIGSHLAGKFCNYKIIILDNFSTGRKKILAI